MALRSGANQPRAARTQHRDSARNNLPRPAPRCDPPRRNLTHPELSTATRPATTSRDQHGAAIRPDATSPIPSSAPRLGPQQPPATSTALRSAPTQPHAARTQHSDSARNKLPRPARRCDPVRSNRASARVRRCDSARNNLRGPSGTVRRAGARLSSSKTSASPPRPKPRPKPLPSSAQDSTAISVNGTPWSSSTWAIRPYGESCGSVIRRPPRDSAFASASSVSVTPK